MSDKISHGTLSTIPEDIFLAKQKLRRDPMNKELAEHLARHLGIKPEELDDILTSTTKTPYTADSQSPSFQSKTDYYKTYKSSPQKGNIFNNPLRYEELGGKKRQRKYKKRTHTKKYKKSKTRRKSMKKYI